MSHPIQEISIAIKVAHYGDVYSYGILLLEMLTGKEPTDDMFKILNTGRTFTITLKWCFPAWQRAGICGSNTTDIMKSI